MKFAYEGFDAQGQRQAGLLEAAGRLEALRELSAKNITPVELEPVAAERRQLFTPRLSRQHITQVLHELTRLIESDVSIAEAVEAIAATEHHPRIDRAFADIARALQRGEALSTALASCGLPLPDYLLHLVQAGELSGNLAAALRRAQEKMEYDQRVASDMRNALTYPAILVVAGVAAVLLMFVVVVPKFSGMLGQQGADLPWLATAVLSTGVWFNANGNLLAAALAALGLGGGLALRRPGTRALFTNWLSRLPVAGRWLEEADMASWAHTLSAMLACRVTLLTALDLSVKAMRIPRRRGAMADVTRLVRAGKSLSAALAETHAMSRTGINLIQVGERTGRVADMLKSLADLYEEGARNRMKRLLALIEPLAILVIGSGIGVIILGIILAITSVNDLAI